MRNLTLAIIDSFAMAALILAPQSVRAEEPKTITNSIGMKLVLIPAGTFVMGSPRSEAERDDKEERHEVKITKPFYLAVCEVTVGQFRRFVEAAAYKTEAETNGMGGRASILVDGKFNAQPSPYVNWRNPGHEQSDRHPVTQVRTS